MNQVESVKNELVKRGLFISPKSKKDDSSGTDEEDRQTITQIVQFVIHAAETFKFTEISLFAQLQIIVHLGCTVIAQPESIGHARAARCMNRSIKEMFECDHPWGKAIACMIARRAARGLSSTWSTLLNQLAVMQKNYIGLLKDSRECKFDLTTLLCIVSLVDTAQFWCKQLSYCHELHDSPVDDRLVMQGAVVALETDPAFIITALKELLAVVQAQLGKNERRADVILRYTAYDGVRQLLGTPGLWQCLSRPTMYHVLKSLLSALKEYTRGNLEEISATLVLRTFTGAALEEVLHLPVYVSGLLSHTLRMIRPIPAAGLSSNSADGVGTDPEVLLELRFEALALVGRFIRSQCAHTPYIAVSPSGAAASAASATNSGIVAAAGTGGQSSGNNSNNGGGSMGGGSGGSVAGGSGGGGGGGAEGSRVPVREEFEACVRGACSSLAQVERLHALIRAMLTAYWDHYKMVVNQRHPVTFPSLTE